MSELIRIPKYQLRVCFHGTLHWLCPWCANHNTDKLHPLTWRVTCTSSFCHSTKQFIPYLGMIPLPAGRPSRPLDFGPVPDRLAEGFPMGELIIKPKWIAGEAVHQLNVDSHHPPFCCVHKMLHSE